MWLLGSLRRMGSTEEVTGSSGHGKRVSAWNMELVLGNNLGWNQRELGWIQGIVIARWFVLVLHIGSWHLLVRILVVQVCSLFQSIHSEVGSGGGGRCFLCCVSC